ncbi:MAG TPA: helix-turn-helix domain-containing protein [Methanosarcina sp.]|nr:helix-turn-helix domain-containing protein [Methanosarcina sp.]
MLKAYNCRIYPDKNQEEFIKLRHRFHQKAGKGSSRPEYEKFC